MEGYPSHHPAICLGFSIINQPCLGTAIVGNHQISIINSTYWSYVHQLDELGHHLVSIHPNQECFEAIYGTSHLWKASLQGYMQLPYAIKIHWGHWGIKFFETLVFQQEHKTGWWF